MVNGTAYFYGCWLLTSSSFFRNVTEFLTSSGCSTQSPSLGYSQSKSIPAKPCLRIKPKRLLMNSFRLAAVPTMLPKPGCVVVPLSLKVQQPKATTVPSPALCFLMLVKSVKTSVGRPSIGTTLKSPGVM